MVGSCSQLVQIDMQNDRRYKQTGKCNEHQHKAAHLTGICPASTDILSSRQGLPLIMYRDGQHTGAYSPSFIAQQGC